MKTTALFFLLTHEDGLKRDDVYQNLITSLKELLNQLTSHGITGVNPESIDKLCK